MIAEQQGAEAVSAAGRIGEADDDELVLVQAFDLEPIGAAAGPVRLVAALGDRALDLVVAGLRKEIGATADLMVAVADHVRPIVRHDLGERLLALLQRKAGEIEAVEIEQIEGEEHEIVGRARGDPVLQIGKIRRAVGRQRDQLAIDQRAGDRQCGQRARQRREFRSPIEPVAGDQPCFALLDARQQAIAVILDLVQPFRAVRRGVDESGELRCDAFGHRDLAGTGRAGARVPFRRLGFGVAGGFALLRIPHPVAVARDRLHRTSGRDAERVVRDQGVAAVRHRIRVALLDQ